MNGRKKQGLPQSLRNGPPRAYQPSGGGNASAGASARIDRPYKWDLPRYWVGVRPVVSLKTAQK